MVNVRHCLSNAAWKHSSFKVSLSLLIAILFISLFFLFIWHRKMLMAKQMWQTWFNRRLEITSSWIWCCICVFTFVGVCFCIFIFICICNCICICICIWICIGICVGDKTNVADAGQEGTGDDLKCFSRESTWFIIFPSASPSPHHFCQIV